MLKFIFKLDQVLILVRKSFSNNNGRFLHEEKTRRLLKKQTKKTVSNKNKLNDRNLRA